MKIILDSPVNKYYVQTLAMIFFPGEHFGEKAEACEDADTPVLYVRSEQKENSVWAFARIDWKGEGAQSEYTAEQNDYRTAERTLKLAVGGAVLGALGERIGYRPAWGMMIGVRPSKVASELLNAGISKTRVKKILNTDYFVIPKKAALATDIALTEKRIVGEPSPKDCSVYISIPFCPSRCTYCSFVSYTSKRLLGLIPQYLVRLKEDIRANFETIGRLGLRVRTVYIGGGTPTILNEEQLRDLLSFIATQTDVTALDEYTLEAGRPDTITEEKFAIAKEYGVSVRTSFNRRYTPLILELMRRVKASGETIISITYQMYRYNRFEPDFSTTAIHAIDVVKHIVGCDYQSVNLSYDHHPELGEGVKNVFLNGHFENGTHFQITLVPTGGAVTERLTVNTLGQSFFVDLPVWDNIDVPGKLLQVSQGNQCQVVTGDMLSDSIEMFDICGFYNENRLYFESLREGKSINDLESAIQSVELEDVVRRSLPHYAK